MSESTKAPHWIDGERLTRELGESEDGLPDEPNMTALIAAAEARGRASRDDEVAELRAVAVRGRQISGATLLERDEARDAHRIQVRRTCEALKHAANQRKEIARLSRDLAEARAGRLIQTVARDQARTERDALRAAVDPVRALDLTMMSDGHLRSITTRIRAALTTQTPDARADAHAPTADGGCICVEAIP